MLGRTRNNSSEQEAKFILDRIASVERNFAELCHAFGAYSRKAARLRDKNDEVCTAVVGYSHAEMVNESMTESLARFAEALSKVGDYGDKRVRNIDEKVVGELSRYESVCKSAKEEVKQIFVARDREVLRRRQLDRARERNPKNRQQIVQAETELVQATAEVNRTVHNLEEHMTSFERRKLHDVKTILLDFIATELGYHAKSVERLTEAYRCIDGFDEDSDLQDFKKAMKIADVVPQQKSLFRSSQSLGSLGSIFSTPKKRTPGIPTDPKPVARDRKVKSDNNLDKYGESKKGLYDNVNDDDSDEDSDESKEEESRTSEEASDDSVDKHVSPFIAKRYMK